MQSYKKTLTIAAAAVIALSAGCRKSLFQGGPRFLREPRPGVHDTPSGPEENPGKRLYITALCGSQAVLLADGIELARGPAGQDPDRIRARQGHLWTDIVIGKETVLYRDGLEWLRFPGEELLAGFLISGEHLHTLGQRPGNGGFCYRIDGKEVFSAPAGRIVGSTSSPQWDAGAFSADSSGIYYAYGIPFVHSSRTSWEYRVMKGGDTVLVIPDDTSGTVLDLRVFMGKVYRAQRTGSAVRFLCGDDVLWSMALDVRDVLSDVRLIPVDGRMCFEFTVSRGQYTDLWHIVENKPSVQSYYGYSPVPHLFRAAGITAFWTETGGRILSLRMNGKSLAIPPGRYRFNTPLCLGGFDGTFAAVLSDTSLTHHLVLTDTLSFPLSLNGTPASIRIE